MYAQSGRYDEPLDATIKPPKTGLGAKYRATKAPGNRYDPTAESELSSRYDDVLESTYRPPKSGLAANYRGTKAPPKRPDSVADSDVSFGWVDDVDFGKSRKDNPAQDLGKSRKGELKNWTTLQESRRGSAEDHRQTYDNNVVRNKPPTGNTRRHDGKSGKPPPGPRSPREKKSEMTQVYRDTLIPAERYDEYESRQTSSSAGWQQMALQRPGQNGEGWDTIFRGMQLRWSDRGRRKPPGSLTIEDDRKYSGSSRSDSTDDDDAVRKRRTRFITALLIFIILMVIAVAATIMGIMLSRQDDKDDSPQYTTFQYKVTSSNLTYHPDMSDPSSSLFIETAKNFCRGVEDRFNSSNIASRYEACVVSELRSGSVIFVFTITITAAGAPVAQGQIHQIIIDETTEDTFILGTITLDVLSLTPVAQETTAAVAYTNVHCLRVDSYENGIITYDGYQYGDTAIVTCSVGYLLQGAVGTTTITCTGRYEWSTLPDCTIVTCPNYTVPDNSMITPADLSNLEYGATFTVTCDEGFDISGEATVTCKEDAQWSTIPTCDLTSCPNVTIPANASTDPATPSVTYMSVYSVVCDEGFTISADVNVTCLADSTWTNQPSCDPVPCPNYAIPADSTIQPSSVSGYVYTDTITVTCNEGYDTTGGNTVTCLANGTWSQSPECTIKQCPTFPIPDNSRIMSTTTGTEYGTSIMVICDEGYQLQGDGTVECLANASWSVIPTCNIVTCEDFPTVQNGVTEPTNTAALTYNTIINITCDIGYTFSTNDLVICQANQTWTVVPTCDPIVCVNYTVPANSVISGEEAVSGHVYLDTLNVECDVGYNIVGDATVTCQADTTWSTSPSCTKVICPDYIIPNNAEIQPTQIANHTYNTVLSVSCNEGYELEGDMDVTCQANGSWTASPMCNIIVCDDFTTPENGATQPESISGITFNSTLTIVCDGGYVVEGEETVRCLANKSWSDYPTCRPINCEEFIYPDNSTQQAMNMPSETSKTYKQEITVTCIDGYVLIGPSTFSCNESGSWPIVECKKIDCNRTEIEKPQLSIANDMNDVYTMQCSTGYTLVGNKTVSCIQGTWTDIPDCEIVSCGDLVDPNNGVITYTSKDYGGTADVVCDSGFEGSMMFDCQANGNWSGVPSCTPVVCPDFSVTNGIISSTSQSPFVFTNEITIDCNEGYIPSGIVLLECKADGEWSDNTTCDPKECDGIVDIDNAIVTPVLTRNLTFGESFTVECVEGYEINGSSSVECQADGMLTKEPTCDIINCPTFPFPSNSVIDQVPETTYNTAVDITCKVGYNLTGVSTSICQANKTWSAIATCQPIQCQDLTLPIDVVTSENEPVITGSLYGETVEVMCLNDKLLVGMDMLSCNPNGTWTVTTECIQTDCDINSFNKPDNSEVIEANNTALKIKCETGYSILGNQLVLCTNGAWGTAPSCPPVDCGELADPSNGIINSTGNTYLETASLTCNMGFEAENSETFVCLSSGEWNDTAACKLVSCEIFTPPQNGFIVDSSTDKDYGDTIEIQCNEGYNLTETGTITCQANRTWSAEPMCEIILCTDAVVILNGNVDLVELENREYGSEVNISCDMGYQVEPDAKITCQANGTWSGVRDCFKVDCNDPDLPDMVSDVTIDDTTYGAAYNLSCVDGYELEGATLIECTAAGTWSTIPNCIPVDCGDYIVPDNGAVANDDGTTYNKIVEFQCNLGYILNGSATITCQANKTWTNGPVCDKVDCGPIGTIANGGYDENVVTTFNETVNIECDEGYEHVDGTTTVCQANGTWSPLPECAKVKCPEYVAPNNGFIVNNAIENEFEDAIEIQCNLGYSLTQNGNLTCQANKTWSGSPECEIVTCDENPSIENGNVDIQTDEDKQYGSMLPILCDEGYEVADNSNVTCEANGTWSGVTNCTLVDCGEFSETIQNGSISSTTGTSYNDQVLIVCDDGFILVGDNPILCRQDGSWDTAPYCEEIECVNPNITSGSYQKINTTIYQVTCDDGHVLVGSEYIECTNEGWNEISVCVERICGDFTMEIINGQITDTTGIRYGDEVRFACNEGYNLNGSEVITCDENANWEEAPTCQPIDCGTPSGPDNGRLLDDTPTTYNTTLFAECNDGFILSGSAGITCQGSGNWSDVGVCEPITCEDLTVGGVYSSLTFTDGSNYGSVATVECAEGYKLLGASTVNCTENGWSDFIVCSGIGNVTFSEGNYEFTVDSVGLLTCTIDNAENWTAILFIASGSGVTIGSINRTDNGITNATVTDRYRFTGNTELQQNDAIVELEMSPVACNDAGTYICGVIVRLGETEDLNFDEAVIKVNAAAAEVPTPTYDAPYTIKCEGTLGVNDTGHVTDSLQLMAKKQGESTFAALVPDFATVTSGECRNTGFLNFTIPQEDGWDGAEVKCVTQSDAGVLESNITSVDIPAANCDDIAVPEVEFGSVLNVTSGDEKVLTVVCNEGYQNFGDVNLTCTFSGWLGTPNCSLIDCGIPSKDSNRILEVSNISTTTYGSIIYGFCEDGYLPQQIFGSENYVTCEETGDWNASFTCEIRDCGNYTDIPTEGSISFTNGTTYRSVVEIACNEGYSLTGNGSTSVCDSSGFWILNGGNSGDPLPSCSVIGGLSLDSDTYEAMVGGNLTFVCSLTNTQNWSRVAIFQEGESDPIAVVDQTIVDVFERNTTDSVEILDSSVFSSNEATLAVRVNNVTCESDGEYVCGVIKGNVTGPTDSNSLRDFATVTVSSNPEQPVLDPVDTNINTDDVVALTCRGNVGQQNNGDPVGNIDVQIMLSGNATFETLTSGMEPDVTQSDCLIENSKSVNVTAGSQYDGAVVRCITVGDGVQLTSDNVTLSVTADCDDIPIPEIEFGSTNNDTSSNKTVLTVMCNEGYENLGDTNLTCTFSGWVGTPNCSLIECGIPSNDSNIIFELTNSTTTTNGSIVYGFCEDGYLPQQIFGSENYVICEETGDWNASFTCEIRDCGNYTDIPTEGSISFTNGTTYGSVVEIACNEGYSLTGNGSTSVCDSSGVWILDGGIIGDPLPSCSIIGELALDSDTYEATFGGDLTFVCTLTNMQNWSRIAIFQGIGDDSSPIAWVDQTSIDVFENSTTDGVDILGSSVFMSNEATLAVRVNNVTCDSDGEYFCEAIKGDVTASSDSNSLTDVANVTVTSTPEAPVLDPVDTSINVDDVVTLTCRGYVGQINNGDPIGNVDVQIKFSGNTSFETLTSGMEPDVTQSDCLIEHSKSVNVTAGSQYDGAVVRCITVGDGIQLTSDNVTLSVTGSSQVVFQLRARDADATFFDDMSDTSSQAFKDAEQDFCGGASSLIETSSLNGRFQNCEVVSIEPGSLIFVYILTFVPGATTITQTQVVTALTANVDSSGTVTIGIYAITVTSVQVTAVTVQQGQGSVLLSSTTPLFTIGKDHSLNVDIQGWPGWDAITMYKTRGGVNTNFANITSDGTPQFADDHVQMAAGSTFTNDGAQFTIEFKPVKCEDDGTYELVLGLSGGSTISAETEITTRYMSKVELTMPVEMREDYWALAIACDASFHAVDDSGLTVTWLMKRNTESTFTTFNPADIVQLEVEYRDNTTTMADLPCINMVRQDFDLDTTDTAAWNNTEFRCALGYGTDTEMLSDIGVIKIVPRSACDGVAEGEFITNPVECRKKVQCNGNTEPWGYVSATNCNEVTCRIGPTDDDCEAIPTITTTTTTTPAPGTPYLACMDTSQTAQRGVVVEYSCELRDIETINTLSISRGGMLVLSEQADDESGISGILTADLACTDTSQPTQRGVVVEYSCELRDIDTVNTLSISRGGMVVLSEQADDESGISGTLTAGGDVLYLACTDTSQTAQRGVVVEYRCELRDIETVNTLSISRGGMVVLSEQSGDESGISGTLTADLACTDTSQTAQRGVVVEYSCELRDIDSVNTLSISRDGTVVLSEQAGDENGISGTLTAGGDVTVDIDQTHLNLTINTTCQSQGTYNILVNNDTDTDLSLALIADPGTPELSLPGILYLNQRTDIRCSGDVGRDENGQSLATLALEVRNPDSATYVDIEGDMADETSEIDCVITSEKTVSVYLTEDFNRSSIRCVARAEGYDDVMSDVKNVTLLQSTISFAQSDVSVYVGETLMLECNVRNTINVARVRITSGDVEVASILSDGTTTTSVSDVEVLDTSTVSTGTSQLAINFTSPGCSSAGDYICEVITDDNVTTSTRATVTVKRMPGTPTLTPSLQIIEGMAPWLDFPMICTAEVGYPGGSLVIQTDKDGGVFTDIDGEGVDGVEIEYDVNNVTCSKTASITYYNTYDMTWDDTTMKCVAKNDEIEDTEVQVEISKTINVVPASFCDNQDANTELPHPHYCYGRLTCTGTSIVPFALCNTTQCYDWTNLECVDCEINNQCDVGSTVAPTLSPGTPTLNCTEKVAGTKNTIVTIQCELSNENITLDDLMASGNVVVTGSTGMDVIDTSSATVVTSTGSERVFVEGMFEARITETFIEINVNLTRCDMAGTYTVKYNGETVLQDEVMVTVTDDAVSPTYSQTPSTFYAGQSVTVQCQGNVGGPSDMAGTLSLVRQLSGTADWTIVDGGVSSTANDEMTCGILATVTYDIQATAEVNGSKLACDTTTMDGQSLRSEEIDVIVAESVFDFGDSEESVEIGSTFTAVCRWDTSVTNESVTIKRRAKNTDSEETVVTYTSTGGVVNLVDGISGEFQQGGSTTPNSLTMNIQAVKCDDEALYTCELAVDGVPESDAEKTFNVTSSPEVPELSLPSTLVLDTASSFTEYLACQGSVGYPAKQLQIQYTKEQGDQGIFSLGTKQTDEVNVENCNSTAQLEYRSITFDSSWNGTELKCVVVDGDTVLTESSPQTVLLIENNCSADNDNQYFQHPYDCHRYYRCFSSGTLAVNTCNANCPDIRNGTLVSCFAAECNCD